MRFAETFKWQLRGRKPLWESNSWWYKQTRGQMQELSWPYSCFQRLFFSRVEEIWCEQSHGLATVPVKYRSKLPTFVCCHRGSEAHEIYEVPHVIFPGNASKPMLYFSVSIRNSVHLTARFERVTGLFSCVCTAECAPRLCLCPFWKMKVLFRAERVGFFPPNILISLITVNWPFSFNMFHIVSSVISPAPLQKMQLSKTLKKSICQRTLIVNNRHCNKLKRPFWYTSSQQLL